MLPKNNSGNERCILRVNAKAVSGLVGAQGKIQFGLLGLANYKKVFSNPNNNLNSFYFFHITEVQNKLLWIMHFQKLV